MERNDDKRPKWLNPSTNRAAPGLAQLRSNDKGPSCRAPGANEDGPGRDLPPAGKEELRRAKLRSDDGGSGKVKPTADVKAPVCTELRSATAKPKTTASGTDGEASRRAKRTRLRDASERAEDRANNETSMLAKSKTNSSTSQQQKFRKNSNGPGIAASATEGEEIKPTHAAPQVDDAAPE